MLRNFLIFLFSFFFVFPVKAGEPDCGFVEENIVEDVYDAAKRVDYFIDVTGDIETACSVSVFLEDWESEQPKNQRHDRKYKDSRNKVVGHLERAFENLRAPLLLYYGYVYGDLNGEIRAVRIARIRAAKKKIVAARKGLQQSAKSIEQFMSSSSP